MDVERWLGRDAKRNHWAAFASHSPCSPHGKSLGEGTPAGGPEQGWVITGVSPIYQERGA